MWIAGRCYELTNMLHGETDTGPSEWNTKSYQLNVCNVWDQEEDPLQFQ